jgi:exonuclease III
MNVLNWNCKGLGLTKWKKLSEILREHAIDVVGIQEKKKEEFIAHMLSTMASAIGGNDYHPSTQLAYPCGY